MSEKTPETNEKGIIAYIFSNDQESAPRLFPLLKLFYSGVYDNTIGIMEVRSKETGKIETVLVGIAHDDDGTTTAIPIARVLNEQALDGYEMPDGNGGWMEPGDQWEEVNATKH